MAIIQLPDEYHTRVNTGAIVCVTKVRGLAKLDNIGPIPPRIRISLLGPHWHEIDCNDESDQLDRFRMIIEAWEGANA